ncbi:MAG: hypothetical protein M3Y56_03470, partial [Armatimonadota bacterium]|nr:hypothetical protein [Armatimonadota bacterium]
MRVPLLCPRPGLCSAAILLWALLAAVPAAPAILTAGPAELSINPTGVQDSGLSMRLGALPAALAVVQRTPVEILIKDGGVLHEYAGGYSKVQIENSAINASATITTEHGSVLKIQDIYHRLRKSSDCFSLDRRVLVVTAHEGDEGFNSRFSLGLRQPVPWEKLQFFSPAVWYNHNGNGAQSTFFGEDQTISWYYREMRTALPFICMRDPGSGLTVALCHLDTNIRSGVNTQGAGWLVDGSIQYASIGATRIPDARIGIIYPAIEGHATAAGWSARSIFRSHPVRAGSEQQYSALFRLTHSDSYPHALTDEWRFFYGLSSPKPTTIPLRQVYLAQIHLLDHYAQIYNG